MQRVIVNYLTREMAILGMVEAVLSFAAIYTVITLAGAPAALPAFVDTLPHDSIALAAFLTVVGGAHRPDHRPLPRRGLPRPQAPLHHYRPRRGHRLRHRTGPQPQPGRRYHGSACDVHRQAAGHLARHHDPDPPRLWHRRPARRTDAPSAADRRSTPGQRPQHQAAIAPWRRVRSARPPVDEIAWPALQRNRIWGVVVASEPQGPALSPLLDCKMRGTRILGLATFHETYLGRIDLDLLTANDLLTTHGFAAGRLTAALKARQRRRRRLQHARFAAADDAADRAGDQTRQCRPGVLPPAARRPGSTSRSP